MTKFIIEIGLNHLGNEDFAWEMVQESIKTNVDAITFQIREDSFYDSSKPFRSRLTNKFYTKAVKAIKESGKKAGIAIASLRTVDYFEGLGVDFWKTLSWDLTNASLQSALHKTGRPVYRSTGLASMEEIVEVSKLYENSTFIHTQLSQNIADVNLKAISTINTKTGKPVAFGLHCPDQDVLKMALAFEPDAIFFYIKKKGAEYYYDDEHAVIMDQMALLIDDLKFLSSAIGDGNKQRKEAPKWVVK
jgi:sialic acid synthase SpsE